MPLPPLLVTAALPYANGPLHLGHLAGAYLPADLYVRYQRLAGRDVVFVCGSDEHGAAIAIRARQEGTSPQAIVDRYHEEIRVAFERLGMSFDIYSRTTSATHRQTSQAMFAAIEAAGGFTRRTQTQPFDPEAGMFLADRFIRGTCPVCGYSDAYGDQCENCGSTLAPEDLIEPRSALSGAAPVQRETSHWYLPLGAMQAGLEAWIDTKTDWKPNVLGQIRSWLAAGLADRAMTRDLPWGVPVPDEPGVDTAGKVLYVWFDAPIGYVSMTREWAEQRGEPEAWRRYWQVHPDGTEPELVHFIGKDNIVFHGLIFPAILQALNAAGTDGTYVLPANVPANEFLNLEGQKFSTSRGWAVWATDALDAFPADLVRYALAAGLPETKDADFTWADFQARVNNDLADVVGNFVNRALTFANRQFDGRVPPHSSRLDPNASTDEFDPENLDLRDPNEAWHQAKRSMKRAGGYYDRVRLRDAIDATVGIARIGNKFFNDSAPWHQIKTDRQAAADTIYVSLQMCAALSILLDPVVPEAAARLRAMLNLTDVRSSTTPGSDDGTLGWDAAQSWLLKPGHALGTPEILFRKIEDAEVEAQRQKLADASAAHGAPAVDEADPDAAITAPAGGPYAPLLAEIAYDDFARLDLRAGRIVAADIVPKADKLLRLDVDLGFETRQILSGIRAFVTPEEAVGRSVVVVANLAPRTMRGLESRGMILMAEDRDGALRFVGTDGEPGGAVR